MANFFDQFDQAAPAQTGRPDSFRTQVSGEEDEERRKEALAILEAEKADNLSKGRTDLAAENDKEIARMKTSTPYLGGARPAAKTPVNFFDQFDKPKAAPTGNFFDQFDKQPAAKAEPKKEEPKEEAPGFFGRLKQSFVDVGVPQAQAGLTGLTVVAQAEQIAKTADKLKQLEAAGQGESREANGLRKTLDFYTQRQGTYFADLATKQAQLSKAPVYTGVKELSEAKTFSEGFRTFAKDPVNIVANLTAQSLPTAVPGLVLGVINPTLGAAAMGGSSFGVEFGNSLLEFAQENGVNTADPKAMAAFFADEKLLREGVNKAGARAGIVGAGDLLLAGLASKTLVPKKITGPVAKNVTNVGAQMGAQAVGGGGFEAAAQVATEGRVTKPGEILAETFGGLGTAPIEVAAQTAQARREIKRAREEAAAAEAAGAETAAEEDRIEPTEGKPIDTRARQIAADLQAVGFPEAESQTIAKTMAEDELARTQEKTAVKGEEALATPPADRLEAKVQEFIDAGVAPDEARLRAETAIAEEDEADALARKEAEGAADVAGTVEGSTGTGVPVAGERGAGVPAAAGVEEPQRSGVVPTGSTAAGVAEGEGTQPAAVESPEVGPDFFAGVDEGTLNELANNAANPSLRQEASKELARRKTAIATATEGEKVGTETAETVQTEAQGQEAPAAPAVEEAPKKRGRPALTEEQKAARQPAQKEAKAAAKKADAAIKKLNDLLDTKVEPDNFADDQAFQEAQTELNNKRGAALREVLMLEPTMQRGSAAGKRLSAAIARPEIPKQQLELVRKGVELSRKATETPSRAEVATAPAREDFKPNTNGVQALGTVIRGDAPPALKAIAQRLRGANAGVKFQVIEQGDPLPPALERNKADWDAARGLFIQNDATGERSIYVKGSSYGEDQGANDITVLHENLHAATNQKLYLGLRALQRGFSTNSKLARATQDLVDLMRRTGEEMTRLDKRKQLPPAVGRLFEATNGKIVGDPREFLAYGMSDPDFQQFLMGLRGAEAETSFFSRFVDTVRRLLGMSEDATNALTDLIVVTDKILSARKTPTMYFLERAEKRAAQKAEGEKEKVSAAKAKPPGPRTQKEIDKEVAIAKEKVRISREGELGSAVEQLQKARNAKDALDVLKRGWGSMTAAQREAAVRLPTLDFLARWSKDDVPRIAEVSELLQRMNGMSLQFLEGAERLTSLMREQFKKDPSLSKKLSDLVYASTLARIDPANPDATDRSAALDADYKALGKAGQDLYVRLRDYYRAVNDLYRNLLDQQIENMSGLTNEVKQNILAKIKQAYETGERIEPFFPLVRRGDYWLSVGSGKNRQFFMYETRGERDAALRKVAAERRVDADELLEEGKVEVGNNVNELRRYSLTGNSSAMLTSIFDAIDSQEMNSPDAREGLKDAIYQIYLQTMPEQSFRSMFIHRKGRAGFSTDLLRNTATTASRMAVQLPRLKYTPLFRNALSAARDSVAERPEFLPFVEETQRRVDLALSGREGGISEAVAGVANKTSYIWYLSSAASALIQPFSIVLTGLPVIGANHNDMAGAAYELGKMMTLVNQYGVTRKNLDGTTSWSAPSLANSNALSADEKRAVKEMTARGVQESTYASLVWEYKRNPEADLDSTRSKGKKAADLLIGGLMHNTERLTREAVYLASYRLGRKQGMSFEEAVQQAVSDTNESLADYDISNRPRWMQKGLGRIAFQFKMYPLHMILLLATNFKRMMPLLNKEGKAEAAKKFFGILGTTGVLAGASGLPLFSVFMGIAGWAWKQMADDDELPDELKDKDFETWFRTVFLPEKLGDVKIGGVPVSDILDRGILNAITGLDIASRIGLNDLWFRDSKEHKDTRSAATAFVIDTFGGPITSIALNWADAYDAFMLGDYRKAMEKASPAIIRNYLIGEKYANEGVKDFKGSTLIPKEDVTSTMEWAQKIGFRPDKVAQIQSANFKTYGIEQKITFERARLMKMINIAYDKGEREKDFSEFNRLFKEEVPKFNKKNPTYGIEDDDVERSLEKRLETRNSARMGIVLTEKNARLFEDVVKNLEKMAKPEEEKK